MPSKLKEWTAWAIEKKLFNPKTHDPHWADPSDIDEFRTVVKDSDGPVKCGELVLTVTKKK